MEHLLNKSKLTGRSEAAIKSGTIWCIKEFNAKRLSKIKMRSKRESLQYIKNIKPIKCSSNGRLRLNN